MIDDIGRDLAALTRLLALPIDLTFAVLPHAPQTAASVHALSAAGREVLLHMPMAPLDVAQLSDELLVLPLNGEPAPALDDALGRVPSAVGINNHMGSALSEAPAQLDRVMRWVAARRLSFLDSKTTLRSQICAVARRHRVPCLQRDAFLDDPEDVSTVDYRLRTALLLARQRGWAIVIGHPLHPTIRALSGALSALEPDLNPVEQGPDAKPGRTKPPRAGTGNVALIRLSRLYSALRALP